MAYLLQWVMIYSFGINTDLRIDPNSIPYTVNEDSVLPYLLQWVMIYSFGIDTDFMNRSQFDSLPYSGPSQDKRSVSDKGYDLKMDPGTLFEPNFFMTNYYLSSCSHFALQF